MCIFLKRQRADKAPKAPSVIIEGVSADPIEIIVSKDACENLIRNSVNGDHSRSRSVRIENRPGQIVRIIDRGSFREDRARKLKCRKTIIRADECGDSTERIRVGEPSDRARVVYGKTVCLSPKRRVDPLILTIL